MVKKAWRRAATPTHMYIYGVCIIRSGIILLSAKCEQNKEGEAGGGGGGQLVQSLRYKKKGGFDSLWGNRIFDLTLPAALWLWVRLSL